MSTKSTLQKHGEWADDAAAQALEEAAKMGGGGKFLKLREGSNYVRVLPPRPGQPQPFRVTFKHYIDVPGVGRRGFVCPRMESKQPCNTCSVAQKLAARGNDADEKRAKKMMPKRRVFFNCIDRDNPADGVKIAEVGQMIHDKMLKIRNDRKGGGNFTDIAKGFDLNISRTGTGEFDTEYDVIADRNSTPLSDDAKQIDEWLSSMHDLERSCRVMSEEEIAALLAGEDPREARRNASASAHAPASTSRTPPRAPVARAPAPRTASEDIEEPVHQGTVVGEDDDL